MIGKDSRYRESIHFQSKGEGDGDFLGIRPLMDTEPRPDDRFHTVVAGDRIDALAFRYLGKADLWWVICDYNGLAFPLELGTGTVLRIPGIGHVEPGFGTKPT